MKNDPIWPINGTIHIISNAYQLLCGSPISHRIISEFVRFPNETVLFSLVFVLHVAISQLWLVRHHRFWVYFNSLTLNGVPRKCLSFIFFSFLFAPFLLLCGCHRYFSINASRNVKSVWAGSESCLSVRFVCEFIEINILLRLQFHLIREYEWLLFSCHTTASASVWMRKR